MKSILFVTQNYYPSTIPDAKRICGFAEGLSKKGYKVTVVSSLSEGEGELEHLNGVKVIRKKTYGKDSFGLFSRALAHVSFPMSASRVKDDGFDFVFVTSPPLFNIIAGIYLKKKFKAKLIFDIRDIWPDVFEQTEIMTKKSIIYKIFSRIAMVGYKKADLITAVTPGKVETLISKDVSMSKKVRFLTNGINDSFIKHEIDTNFALNFNSDFNVIYTGKIGMAQNLGDFINLAEVFKENESIKFYLMGHGNELNAVLDSIKSKRLLNIVYLGNVTENEVYTAIKSSQLAFVSLINAKLVDSVPTKIFENLLLGCPILLSAKGDSEKIIDDSKLGISVEPGKFDDLVESFNQIYDNYDLFVQNKNHAFEIVNKYYMRSSAVKNLDSFLCELDSFKN